MIKYYFRPMKKIILLILLFVLTQTTYAAEFKKLNLPSQVINPGDFYYPIKRLWEKAVEKFQFKNDAKFKYSNYLIDKRMSELGYVVKNKRLDDVQRSSERLAYQVGILTDFLMGQNDRQMKNQLQVKINNFLPVLSELRDNFPANSSFWMLVQHDINALKEYAVKLN